VYASPLSIIYLSGGVYPRGTYTIWREGSNFYAKDSHGKLPSWSENTNARAVIQNASDALVNGGSIFLMDGEYPLEIIDDGTYKYGITLRHDGLSLICDKNAWLKVPDNSLSTDLPFGVVTLSYGYEGFYDLYAKVNIDGNRANQGANKQTLVGVSRPRGTSTVEECHLANATGYAIWVGSGGAMDTETVYILNNYMHDCVEAGLHTENVGTLVVEGNIADKCHSGYVIGGYGHRQVYASLVGNIGINSHTEHGTYICDHVYGARVVGNLFHNNTKSGIRAGNAGAYALLIADNVCSENGIGGIWLESVVGEPNASITVDIIGNICFNNTNNGIQVHKTRNVNIVGNTVTNNTDKGINVSDFGYKQITANFVVYNKIGIQLSFINETSVINNRARNNTDYDLILWGSSESGGSCYNYIASNYLGSMYLNHTGALCEYNYVFGNYIENLSQSAGSPSGNNYTHNYPDNTP